MIAKSHDAVVVGVFGAIGEAVAIGVIVVRIGFEVLRVRRNREQTRAVDDLDVL